MEIKNSHIIARLWPLLVPIVAVTVIALIGMSSGPVIQRVVLTGLVNLILVVGLYIFVGNSGIMSFGHIAFMAIGAYTSALLTIPTGSKAVLMSKLPDFLATAQMSPVSAAIIGGLAAALVALIFALPVMRLTGISAGIASFCLLAIVQNVFSNTPRLFGQSGTIVGIPTVITLPWALAAGVCAIVIAYLFQRSRLGQLLRASRDDEVAARGLGIAIVPQRVAAFVLSAFVVGVGGAAYAQMVGAFSPKAFFVATTFITIAMLVIGGTRSLLGAVLGVITISICAEGLRNLEGGMNLGFFVTPALPGLREMGMAAIMIIALIFRPRGITNGREARWPWGRHEAERPQMASVARETAVKAASAR